jgi:two-component system, chemotaxis family, chemotaxis protein CheY
MRRILIVDDMDSIRKLIEYTLKIKGYNILTATNGKDALKLIEEKPEEIGLIISDYNMPIMNGMQLLEKVKTNNRTFHIPFFFLTTEKDPEKKLNAKKSGVAAWIKKPYQLNEFLEQISNHILS